MTITRFNVDVVLGCNDVRGARADTDLGRPSQSRRNTTKSSRVTATSQLRFGRPVDVGITYRTSASSPSSDRTWRVTRCRLLRFTGASSVPDDLSCPASAECRSRVTARTSRVRLYLQSEKRRHLGAT